MKLWPGWLVVLAAATGGCSTAASSTTTPNSGTPNSGTPNSGTANSGTANSGGSISESNGSIVRVIDGDTVDVDFNGTEERVRLIGIDTPETKKPNTAVQCFGPEASAFTGELLPVGTVILVTRDVEARDDYGRLLGYVYRSSDGLFVNLELVIQGYARPLTIAPNVAFAPDFVGAALRAEATDTGRWRECSG